jgi:hypothetical protein
MEGLKSRINRCSKIISSFESIPQAITVRSNRLYPDNQIKGMTKSIHYDDLCDFKLAKNYSMAEGNINTKPYNPQEVLGKPPDGTLEDVKLTQELLNTIETFKEVKTEFVNTKGVFKDLFEGTSIPTDIERFNSLFNYTEKVKILGVKYDKSYTGEPSSSRDSHLLNDFMNAKKQKHVKKLQDAPVSIIDNVKMAQYRPKRELIRRGNNKSFEVNLPENINLPMISQFDSQTSPLEDYFAEETDTGNYLPQETIYGDDEDDFQMPIDIIKNYNRRKSKDLTRDKADITKNTSNEKVITNSKAEEPKPNEINYKTRSLNQESESKPNLSSVPNIQSVPNIPSVPLVPPVSSVPVVLNIPQVPIVPKVPNMPIVPKVPAVPSVPNVPKVPVVPQTQGVSKNPEPLRVESIEQQDKEVKSMVGPTAKANLLDEIRSNEPMSRLKKIGSVHIGAEITPECLAKPELPKGNDQNTMVI